MNQTFEQRIQSIEDQLKEIRKELEESLALYKQRGVSFYRLRKDKNLLKIEGEGFNNENVGEPWRNK